MLKISKISLITVSLTGLLLGGCSLEAKPADMTTESPTKTMTGTIKVTGEKIMLQDTSGVSTELDSRKVDLKTLDGKKVTVTGEFSGTTLFVDKAE